MQNITQLDVKRFMIDKFIIVNKTRSKNKIQYWCSNGCGYTDDLFNAGFYSSEDIVHLLANNTFATLSRAKSVNEICNSKSENVFIDYFTFINTLVGGVSND